MTEPIKNAKKIYEYQIYILPNLPSSIYKWIERKLIKIKGYLHPLSIDIFYLNPRPVSWKDYWEVTQIPDCLVYRVVMRECDMEVFLTSLSLTPFKLKASQSIKLKKIFVKRIDKIASFEADEREPWKEISWKDPDLIKPKNFTDTEIHEDEEDEEDNHNTKKEDSE